MILPESPRWNQVTKQESVVEGYPDVRKTDALGRVYVVHANKQFCFHLRILLHVVKPPTPSICLSIFQGIIYEIFQGFCKTMYSVRRRYSLRKYTL